MLLCSICCNTETGLRKVRWVSRLTFANKPGGGRRGGAGAAWIDPPGVAWLPSITLGLWSGDPPLVVVLCDVLVGALALTTTPAAQVLQVGWWSRTGNDSVANERLLRLRCSRHRRDTTSLFRSQGSMHSVGSEVLHKYWCVPSACQDKLTLNTAWMRC